VRIISVTATLVNVFRYVRTIRFRVGEASSVQRLRFDVSAIASTDANAIGGLAGASEKASKSNKWKKAKPKTQNLYWSDGFVYDLGSFGLTQNKTKMGKKIKKRLENHGKELVWGKHKNVKNQLQKNQKTRGKFGKEKQKEDRCVRE